MAAEQEPGTDVIVLPGFYPAINLLSDLPDPFRHCLNVFAMNVSISEVVSEVIDRVLRERIDQGVIIQWVQIQSVFVGLHEVGAIPIKAYREYATRRK